MFLVGFSLLMINKRELELTLLLWIPSFVATSGAPQFLGSLFCFRSGDHGLRLKFGGDLLKYTPLRITCLG